MHTPRSLYDAVKRGEIISERIGGFGYTLQERDGSFQMLREDGQFHSISSDWNITSPERLAAHWMGFRGRDERVQAGQKAVPNRYRVKAGEAGTYFRNQAERDASVLAVIGDKALIAYDMPSGVTYLNFVHADGTDEPGAYRAVSRQALSSKWRKAIAEQHGPAAVYEKRWTPRGNQLVAFELTEEVQAS